MAENVGTVYYTVDAKTDPLVQSGREAEKQLDRTTAAMGKTDTAANKLGNTSRKAGDGVDKFAKSANDAQGSATAFRGALSPLAAAISGLIALDSLKRLQETAEAFTLLSARINRLSGDAEKGAQNYQSLLSIANRTGATLGDTTKLWESLTLTLRDLGGTDAQVLRLTETLQKIGAVGGSSAEDMSNALRQLGQALAGGTLRAEEFNSIVEGMPQLAREIANGLGVPFGELRQLLLDGKLTADVVLGAIQKRTAEVDAEFAKLPRTVGQAANALANEFGSAISKLDQAVSLSKSLAAAMDYLAGQTRKARDQLTLGEVDAELKQLEETAGRIASRGFFGVGGTEIQKRIDELRQMRVELKKQEREQARASAPIETTGGPKGDAQSLKALEGLKEEAALAKLAGEERAKAAAIAKLGAGATQAEKDQAAALAVEIFKANEAKKEGVKLTKQQTTEAEKQAAAQMKGTQQNEQVIAALSQALAQAGLKAKDLAEAQAVMRLNPYATPQQIAQVKALADAIYQAEQAKANKALLGQVDPLAGEQQRYEQQLKDYQTLNDAKLLSDQRYVELKGQAEQAHTEKMRQLEEERWAAQSMGNQLILDGLNALQQQGTQAIAGLIAGTNSFGDAWRSVAASILQQGVGALVQIGIQQAKNFVMGQTQQAAATATAAASGGAMAASYAPAAAAASIASFGAAASAGLAAVSSAIPAILGFFGGRAQGGPVQAGGMYRINETGQPEVFQAANGRQYMLPNSRGEVISNRDASRGIASAGGGVTVNLIEDKSRAGTVQSQQNADGSMSVDAFVASIRGDGPAAQAIESKYGLTPVGT